MTPSAIQQRLTRNCVNLMRGLLEKACAFYLAAEPLDLELTQRFAGISVEDCTSIQLMASWSDEFPGCGGAEAGQGAAGLKALLRIEVKSGALSLLAWDRGREHDLNFSRKAGDVPAGSLYLADLGFWCPERLDHFTKQGVFWVSRVPAGRHADHRSWPTGELGQVSRAAKGRPGGPMGFAGREKIRVPLGGRALSEKRGGEKEAASSSKSRRSAGEKSATNN